MAGPICRADYSADNFGSMHDIEGHNAWSFQSTGNELRIMNPIVKS